MTTHKDRPHDVDRTEINAAIAAMKYAVDSLDSCAESVSIPSGTLAHDQLREVVRLADRAESLSAQLSEAQARLAEIAQQEPVSAQHRFRHPQKSMPDWSPWQQCEVLISRQSWAIDSAGYEIEYRPLYAAPVAPAAQTHFQAVAGKCLCCCAKHGGAGFTQGCAKCEAEKMLAAKQQKVKP